MNQDTEKQIENLEQAAGQAGDIMMAAICQIALLGQPKDGTFDALDADDRYKLQQEFGGLHCGWLSLKAEQECLRVIEDNKDRQS